MSAADPAEVLAALGVTAIESITPITEGLGGTSLWRVRAEGDDVLLRLFPRDWDRLAERELVAQEAAGASGVPVPRLVARGDWNERPAFVLSWLPGTNVLQALLARPERAVMLGRRFGRVQARLHQARAPERLRELSDSWLGWGHVDDELVRAIERINPRDDALLHLDYHPMNVMVHGGRTSGVIDWANARAGDPRADVARTLTILTLLPFPGQSGPRFSIARRAFARSYLNAYQQSAGRLSDFWLFLAWAAEATVRDLEPGAGQPGVWITAEHLDGVRRAAAVWRARARVPPSA